MDDVGRIEPDHLRRVPTKESGHGGRDPHDGGSPQVRHDVGGVLCEDPVPRLAVGQRRHRLVPPGDIAPGDAQAFAHPVHPHVEPDLLPANLQWVAEVVHDGRPAGVDYLGIDGEQPVCCLAGQELEQAPAKQFLARDPVIRAGRVVRALVDEIDDATIAIAHRLEIDMRIKHRVEGRLEALAVEPRTLRGGDPVGDVTPGDAQLLANADAAQIRLPLLPDDLVEVGQRIDNDRLTGLDDPRIVGEDPRRRVAGQDLHQPCADHLLAGPAVVRAGGLIRIEEDEVDDGPGFVADRLDEDVRIEETVDGRLQPSAQGGLIVGPDVHVAPMPSSVPSTGVTGK